MTEVSAGLAYFPTAFDTPLSFERGNCWPFAERAQDLQAVARHHPNRRTLQPGFTPDRFAVDVIGAYVRRELKGRLVTIEPRYRQHKPEPS